MSLPRLEKQNGRTRLVVDDRPFLILGLQWDCDSCFSPEEMNPLFPEARKLGANTAALPTYWREIEPEPGRFDFAMIDERIRMAEANGLRLVLLWFATWKNGTPIYAPDYIRNDPATYRPALDRDGQATISHCPTSEATWGRDRDALVALMKHLRDHDPNHAVIIVQIENEAGVFGSDRCYCADCNARFAAGGYEAKYGERAAEAFSVICFARYIDRLAGEAKAVLPLPTYANVWLDSPGAPAGAYPSGGAVPPMLALYRQLLEHLDFVAPDIYVGGQTDFSRLCDVYSADGNPLYIAEHSSSLTGRAERNVFYAIGRYGALGFDPWAIDSPYPEIHGQPLVDPIGQEWGPQAYWLRDSYVAIGRAIEPIAAAQGTDRLFAFVQEPGEHGTGWTSGDIDCLVSYTDRDNAARGLIIREADGSFVLVGIGCAVRFRQRGTVEPVPVAAAEWGRFDGSTWKCLHPVRRERLESVGLAVPFLEPGVARVVLKTH